MKAATPREPRKKGNIMTDKQPSGAQRAFGDFAPALVELTDDVLFGQVWARTQLSPKERSLVTVAALTTNGNTEQLVYHLGRARDNGASADELIEAITHLAFYAGWPQAMSAMAVAKQVLGENSD
jgi:4-carboxymuconolactone decarboxylase